MVLAVDFFQAASKRARHDVESEYSGQVTLYEIVRQGKMSSVAVVDDWIEGYQV